MKSSTTAHCIGIVLAIWLPLGLGCILTPGGGGGGTDVPPVEDDGCSDDHDQYYEADPAGAQIAQASDGVACNSLTYFSGGGAQGSATFHIEPMLRVEGHEPSAEPTITWSVMELDGTPIDEQGIELYSEDIVYTNDGFDVTSRVFIDAGLRGKNVRLRAVMDVVDPDARADSDAGNADAGYRQAEPIDVAAEAAFYIEP